MKRSLLITLAMATVACSFLQAEEAGGFVRQEPVDKIASPSVDEASGVAISTRDPQLMWIINDSGAKPVLHAASTHGKDLGQITVENAQNIDWEDLAAFKLDGVSYLLVPDTGDNASKRQDCKCYIVPEPKMSSSGVFAGSVKPAWTISFSFEGGPRDCEAVAVDEKAGKIILVSKRTKPPMVYEMPLRPKEAAVVAKKVGETSVKIPKGALPLPFIEQPTGLDFSPDRSEAAIVTYYGVFLFPRAPKESWAEAFAKAPVALAPHGMEQAESVAFSADGKSLLVLSEGKQQKIVVYRR